MSQLLSATQILVVGYSWQKIPNFRSLVLDAVNRTHLPAVVLSLLGILVVAMGEVVVKGCLVFIRSSGRVDMVTTRVCVVLGSWQMVELVVSLEGAFVALVTGQVVFGSMPMCLFSIKLTLQIVSVTEFF